MRVGFIGLGLMGNHMATNIQKGGHEMVVHDLRADAAKPHLAAGAKWAASPKQVAEASDVVFTSLPTPPDVEAVALGDNGQGEARIERGLMRLGWKGRDEPAPGLDYEPNVFLYDNYPGGIGLSEPLYRLHPRLLGESLALIAACGCRDGCPSCVGPAGEIGSRGKEVALALLRAILV